ncbi:furin-like protease 2 [Lepeophtheirus salmonis]|uniref:furin-like protease 2 n=1 Tax=Lepeophtheirus salmonis TaxID=72036 RepID=UPI001AE26DD2|nr:furin-like protease 2 [Lepeophtheirus salmonis]
MKSLYSFFGIILPLLVTYSRSSQHYQNQFAVYIPKGKVVADTLAQEYGFENIGQIGTLDNYFLFKHSRINKRSTDAATLHAIFLTLNPEVKWFEQQKEKKRVKRDFNVWSPVFDSQSTGTTLTSSSIGKRQGFRFVDEPQNLFADPIFTYQWHLNAGARNGFDMNVKPAWKRGYSGTGVVVTILDDGIQMNHPDLISNYDPLASTDINDNDADPMPQDNGNNKHGTRCAGEVAASANNGVCGVGIAYNASIGGVRMLDGVVNDAVEARALSLNPDHVDIYSASWGPEDDGKTVDGPGPLAKRAFLNGVVRGRQGKGSIFVWASGNGGRHSDNCNCDGYTNSIFTLSISSATQGGYKPWYLEECSSTLATTYSSGTPGRDGSISTVDQDARLRSEYLCTSEHTGTSASAPIAAAVCALALEANPSLTWRDMQYLVVMTSRSNPLKDESGWAINGAGRSYSHQFGYGLMDADHMVRAAVGWKALPQQHICQTPIMVPNIQIPDSYGIPARASIQTDGCSGTINSVNYLEHVQCKISLKYYPRGNLMIMLTSPSGTKSTLLFPRPKDNFATSFQDWPFLSVHFYGEIVPGTWKLEVLNMGSSAPLRSGQGLLKKWQLIFYGTENNPIRVPRNINIRNGKSFFGSIKSSFPRYFTLGPVIRRRALS